MGNNLLISFVIFSLAEYDIDNEIDGNERVMKNADMIRQRCCVWFTIIHIMCDSDILTILSVILFLLKRFLQLRLDA